MTMLDDPEIISIKSYGSAPPITGNRTMTDIPCVCAPSRALWWRYPMPGTRDTVGMYVLLAVMLTLDVVLWIMLAWL